MCLWEKESDASNGSILHIDLSLPPFQLTRAYWITVDAKFVILRREPWGWNRRRISDCRNVAIKISIQLLTRELGSETLKDIEILAWEA